MKTKSKKMNVLFYKRSSILFMLIMLKLNWGYAENPSIGVLNIEVKGIQLDPEQAGNLVFIELEKLGSYEVKDRHDIKSILEKNQMTISNCYGKECIINAGKVLKLGKMVGGTIEKIDKKIFVSFRLINVENGSIEKTQVNEFMDIPSEMQNMISITLKNIMNINIDKDLESRLKNENSFESSTSNPGLQKISASGPRMGLTFVDGKAGKRITASEKDGGYDAYPLMTQLGYQFETQYINSGNFQALVEAIPMVTGIDQGFFNPSFTILNGLRNSKNGWELGFGAAIGFSKMASGYYDENQKWNLEKDWNTTINGVNNYEIIEQADSRGTFRIVTGFVLAVGKTFRSGKLNIPVNIYVIPDKSGVRVGVNFGFNITDNN